MPWELLQYPRIPYGWHFFFTDRKRFSQTYIIFAQNAVGIVSMAKLNLFFPFRWEIHFAQTYLISNQILEMIKITTCVLFWGDHHIQCCLLRYILPCLWFILKSFDLLKHQIIAAGELHPVWGPGLGAIGLVLDALQWGGLTLLSIVIAIIYNILPLSWCSMLTIGR